MLYCLVMKNIRRARSLYLTTRKPNKKGGGHDGIEAKQCSFDTNEEDE